MCDTMESRWAEMDPNDEGSMTHVQFRDLLLNIDPPLGLKGCPDFIVNHKMRQLDCPLIVPSASKNDPSTYVKSHMIYIYIYIYI